MSSTGPTISFSSESRTALLWSSIGLAVFTSLLQGLATTVVAVAEDQGMWTFRFRIARFEHWWWTIISVLLSVSFSMIVLSFLSGNNNDAVGVLALSTATTLAIVRYALPAWTNKRYIENRWLAWTGSSRTAIRAIHKDMCGDARAWRRLADEPNPRPIVPADSDLWGLALNPPKGLWQDPTAILDKFGENKPALIYSADWPIGPCVFDDGLDLQTGNVSLLWGTEQGFRPRVSRGINSLPKGLLASRPYTVDGYNGEGLCLAFGLLGRNKGLAPERYVFDLRDALKTQRGIRRGNYLTRINTELEGSSTWNPRANKVMRSYYTTAVDEQFGTLPQDFRYAAVELALILLDIEEKPLRTWLSLNLDQQSLAVNMWMSARPIPREPRPRASARELETLYRASYTSMIISINYFAGGSWLSTSRTQTGQPVRPDLICFALLLLGEDAVVQDSITGKNIKGPGADRPQWWTDNWVHGRLRAEYAGLKEGWREPAAWLLGLLEFPPELDVARWPSWPDVRYEPLR